MSEDDGNVPQRLAVLIVEDSRADAELSIHALRDAGFAVDADVVETREAFERALSSKPHDIVLCDHGLPGWDSFDVLARVRQHGDVPFIVVTGTIGEEQAVECVKRGATDSVLKDHLTRLPLAVKRALSDHRHQRERAAAELRFARAFHANPIPMAITTLADGRIVEVNESFVRVFGYTREELVGQCSTDLGIWRSVDDRSAIVERLETEGSLREVEVTLRTRGGAELNGNYTADIVDMGGVPHLLAMFQDMTERRRVEAQLRQSLKMEAVGRLAGGVAHDFNNVLTAISGYCALLEMEMEGDPRLADVTEIRKASERAAGLTRQLLAISRRQVLRPVVLDLNELVRDLQNMLSRTIGDDVQLEALLAAGAGTVRGDPGQLEQVVLNLAINARDAMPNGGTLTIQTSNVELSEPITGVPMPMTPGNYVVLSVTDTGTGMDEATRAQIFEPFFTTKDVGKGTGLGLATAYGIVKQTGGFIWVYSEPGLGTTFKVYLPRVDEPVAAHAAGALPPVRGGTETIMVVEHDAAVRIVTRQILEHRGYRVREAVTPGEALDLVRRLDEPINLVLSDLVMPRLSGREMAHRMREMRPDMPIIYMSGYTDGAAVRHGVLEQGAAFIEKPFTAEALSRKVRDVLDATPVSPALGAADSRRTDPPRMPQPFMERRRAGLRGMDSLLRSQAQSRPDRASAGVPRPMGSEVVLLVEDDAAVRNVMTRALDVLGYVVLPAANTNEAIAIAIEHRGTIHVLISDVRMARTPGPDVFREVLAARPGMGVLFVSGEPRDSVRRFNGLPHDAEFLTKPFSTDMLRAKVHEILDRSSRAPAG